MRVVAKCRTLLGDRSWGSVDREWDLDSNVKFHYVGQDPYYTLCGRSIGTTQKGWIRSGNSSDAKLDLYNKTSCKSCLKKNLDLYCGDYYER